MYNFKKDMQQHNQFKAIQSIANDFLHSVKHTVASPDSLSSKNWAAIKFEIKSIEQAQAAVEAQRVSDVVVAKEMFIKLFGNE